MRLVRGSRRETFAITSVPQAYLGAEIRDAGHGRAGAAVRSVAAAGPAATGGIRPGDVITAIDGEPVSDVGQVFVALARHRRGRR